jgi:dTDP-4-amino-4,6-dideoxygalactose transaminase
MKRDRLQQYLMNHGIGTVIHYPIPPYRQKAMQGILGGEWPVADELHASELSLPISAGHSAKDIKYVSEILCQFRQDS